MSVLCYNKITNEQMFENILRAKEKHTTEKKKENLFEIWMMGQRATKKCLIPLRKEIW